MCIQEMLFRNLINKKFKNQNLLLGYPNLNSSGKAKILKIWLKDKILDGIGKEIKKDLNVLLKLWIGSDFILMNMLVTLLDWLLPHLLIDAILLLLKL
mgnify:CR=1 FL=1